MTLKYVDCMHGQNISKYSQLLCNFFIIIFSLFVLSKALLERGRNLIDNGTRDINF